MYRWICQDIGLLISSPAALWFIARQPKPLNYYRQRPNISYRRHCLLYMSTFKIMCLFAYSKISLCFMCFYRWTSRDRQCDREPDSSAACIIWDDWPSTQAQPVQPCECKRNKGQPCYTLFKEDEVELTKLQYLGLSREELDLTLLAKIESGIHLSTETCCHKQKKSERTRQRVIFTHHGAEICRHFFLYLHNIGEKKLKNVCKHYKLNGVETRVHKLTKKLPSHALSFEDVQITFHFISNFAEANAIILPGRTPFAWKSDCKRLPTNCSRRFVYNKYVEAVSTGGNKKISLRRFFNVFGMICCHLWKTKSLQQISVGTVNRGRFSYNEA